MDKPEFPVEAWRDEQPGDRAAGPSTLRVERVFDTRSRTYGYEARFQRYRATHPLRRVAIAMLRDRARQDGLEV